ncbi:branched-chain amino acid transport system substrate-binding protein [Bradyrhizobium sp. NFR13]|jgi:branched-chain amino acid transport system substrate-binding protein|uniref:ABC transporter substrate-binding protein n=1 Tax=Bradyrhizobium sp. NFR13 TaxID=1566285 RepID=UPI0008E64825|nr:ABC transporter substrate-binding protein [Bradyrhizobium sp. NFR13]SFM17250.1 branched-chain amino acid transport system substrate-binding protein [Bradyrhizobium sp. NFR13]
MRTKKRTVTQLSLAGAFALALFATSAQAQISDDVVKIGVLTDMNGPASTPSGQGSVIAAQMAVDDFGGTVLGKPISIIIGDHQLKPDVGASLARRWYDVDQVDIIVDVPVSAVGLAVQNVANDRKRLFITHSTGAADFHGKFCSPYTMQWVFDTRALAVGTAQEVVKRGGDSWFFITDDFAFGHALERDAAAVVTRTGGKVIGSVRPPFGASDLSSFVLQAQASKAKIIGIAGGPPNNINEIKTAGEFGVFKGGQQMAALLALITDIDSLGLQTAQGLLLTTAFYWDMDDKTRAWSKRFFEKTKRMPTMWQAGVYSSTMVYLNAIKEAGTDEPLKVAAKMREKPIEDFFARNGKLREDGLMVHDLMLVQVKSPEESKYPWDYYKILAKISGEEAFGPPDPACALGKK